MHSHIAYHLADQRHAELIAEAAHQRLINETRQARTDAGRPTPSRAPLVVVLGTEASHWRRMSERAGNA